MPREDNLNNLAEIDKLLREGLESARRFDQWMSEMNAADNRKKVLRGWFARGVQMGATHMIIVRDTPSYEDYPVFVMPEENIRKKYDEINGKNMRKVTEVYSLHKNMEMQLNEYWAFHFD